MVPLRRTTLEGQLVADTTAFGRPDVAELWHYMAQVHNEDSSMPALQFVAGRSTACLLVDVLA